MTFWEKLVNYCKTDLWVYLGETLEMVAITALIALVFGLALGLLMYFTRKSKRKGVNILYKVLDVIVSIFRSFPFYVLMFFVIPFTRVIMEALTGKAQAFSTEAFIVPLSLAAIPFFGKLIENALIEINDGVVEAATSLGLSKTQIIFRVVLKEALPAIISGVTLGIVTLVGYSAMAGAVGGGGLGFFAYDKGFVSYDFELMLFAVVTIIILVLIIQFVGNILYKLARKGKIDFRIVGIILGSLLVVLTGFVINSRVSAAGETAAPKKIAVANDSSNLKRCLELLESEGLIEIDLPEGNIGAADFASYITNNPYGLEIVPMTTASIANALNDKDVALGIVNATFAINAGLGKELMIMEEKDPTHKNANILAIRDSDKNSIFAHDLVKVLESSEVSEFINQEFKGVIKPYIQNHLTGLPVGNKKKNLVLGTMSQPGEPILKFAKAKLEELGYSIEIKIYSEFDALNHALVDGSVDANLFQHEPYLNSYNNQHDTNLFNALTMYDCVYGGYTKKGITVEDLKKSILI